MKQMINTEVRRRGLQDGHGTRYSGGGFILSVFQLIRGGATSACNSVSYAIDTWPVCRTELSAPISSDRLRNLQLHEQ
jgi:hypothetical protein